MPFGSIPGIVTSMPLDYASLFICIFHQSTVPFLPCVSALSLYAMWCDMVTMSHNSDNDVSWLASLHQCWSWAGRWWWWWWLELHVVAASRSNLRWCLSWSLHLAPWPLHLVLAVVVTSNNLQCWCFSLGCWYKYSTCTHGGFTRCNLHRRCFFFHPLAQILNLHSSNLHCVVIQYASNLWLSGRVSRNLWWCMVCETLLFHCMFQYCMWKDYYNGHFMVVSSTGINSYSRFRVSVPIAHSALQSLKWF